MTKKKKVHPSSPHKREGKKAAPTVAPLQSRLSLKSVRLIETHAKLNITGNKFPTELNTSIEVNFGGHLAEKLLLGNVRTTLSSPTAPDEGEAKSQSSLVIVAHMQCLFDLDDVPDVSTLPKEEVSAINNMLTIIVWPYVRQYVQSVTAAMCIPPFTLPLIRMQVVPDPAIPRVDSPSPGR